MANSLVFTHNASLAGKAFSMTKSSVTGKVAKVLEADLLAAKAGTLSVRTDANTGTLTLASGHGVSTGNRLDIYWSGGRRRGVVVGTVSGTSVPIDLGTGDDLPIATTPITCQVPTEIECVVDGTDFKAFQIASESGGEAQVVFAETDDDEIQEYILEAGAAAGWYTGSPVANPLTGGSIAKVYFSHAATTTAKVRFGYLHD